MSLYLDTSVIVPLFVREATTMALLSWIATRDETVYVSDLAVAEFHSAISRLRRMGRVEAEQSAAIRAEFDLWCGAAAESLQLVPADIRKAGQLVQVPLPWLLTPDAIHLEICRRLDLTFATSDFDLHEIAEREGIRWVSPAQG